MYTKKELGQIRKLQSQFEKTELYKQLSKPFKKAKQGAS